MFALDADGNLRTYDLFHFTKIFRVNPGVIGNRKMKFSIPDPIVELGRGKLYRFLVFLKNVKGR